MALVCLHFGHGVQQSPPATAFASVFLSIVEVTRPESEPTSLSRLGVLRLLQDALAEEVMVVFAIVALLDVLQVSPSILIPMCGRVYA